MKEMNYSIELSAWWPIFPFGPLANMNPGHAKISPIVQRIAKAMSPDCNDPFAFCFLFRGA
jgi:hypothetical protein